MSRRKLRILYVEDEPLQQKLLAHALGKIPDFECEVAFATTEADGMTAFLNTPFDAVFVDYQLAEGDGLGLIRKIRAIDPLAPVIALSGVASAEIAAELIVSGADDYLSKSGMDTKTLTHSLKTALLRSDGLRKRMAKVPPTPLQMEVVELSQWVNAIGPGKLLAHMDRCEKAARSDSVQAHVVVEWFEAAANKLAADETTGDAIRLALRPFLLDLLTRLDNSSATDFADKTHFA